MSVISMKQLLEAGVHFGHQTRRWNPKMAPYIFTERNGIHIIDLQKSVGKVDEAYKAVFDIASQGGTILFVGTKKQAQDAVRVEAERCGMFYVNERWLGGMLTNFKTIRSRIERLKQIEIMSQDGTFDVLPKKEVIALRKEWDKLEKNLGGIKEMTRIPDAIFVVDPKKERICVQEAHTLGITLIGIGDTNSDPEELDYIIPGNDDAIRAVKLIVSKMADAVIEANQTRRWNPKMAPYIFTERNGIHIIDLQKSVGKVDEAYKAVFDIASQGGTILFVGTKKQAQDAVRVEAERCGMFYVNERWLGGMLTNFKTIRSRIERLKQIEIMSQDGTFDVLPKKEVIALRKEWDKLEKNLGGIKEMTRIPDAIFVVDPKKERICVQEAHTLGITLIGIGDTNSDPEELDYIIPGNDDAIRAVKLIVSKMADAVIEANQGEEMVSEDVAAEMAEAAGASEATDMEEIAAAE